MRCTTGSMGRILQGSVHVEACSRRKARGCGSAEAVVFSRGEYVQDEPRSLFPFMSQWSEDTKRGATYQGEEMAPKATRLEGGAEGAEASEN